MKKVCWIANTRTEADGYAYAARKLMEGLSLQGVDVRPPEGFDLFTTHTESSVNITLEKGFYTNHILTHDPEIVVNNCLPTEYQNKGKYKIGFSYWETDTLPTSWIPKIQAMDEIWTTSSWAKTVFDQYHDNVHAFKLGIDSDIFHINPEPPKTSKFTFLHVGSPSKRKNSQTVVDAFIKAFGGNSDYHLIIKSNGPPDCRWIGEGVMFGPVSNHPQITVIDFVLSDKGLADLYSSVHCLVYPTFGEGWGMIPFQSIAVGTPTICTNATACTEFAEMSIPIKAQWTDEYTFGIYKGGRWAYPSIIDVCEAMKYAVDCYDSIKQKTVDSAAIIHKEYNWEKVAGEYKDRICQI